MTGDPYFICELCFSQFTNQNSLDTHRRMMHNFTRVAAPTYGDEQYPTVWAYEQACKALTKRTAERDAHLLQVARLEMQLQAKQDALAAVIAENTANVAALAEARTAAKAWKRAATRFRRQAWRTAVDLGQLSKQATGRLVRWVKP